MAIQYSTAHRTAAMGDLVTQVGTSAVIKIFTGTQPATCATADSGTLLVTLTGNVTQFGTTASGVLTISNVTSGTAGNTGATGYFRIYPSAATTTNAVIQGSAGTSGDLVLSSSSINTGNTVSITNGATITAFGA